MKIDILKTTPIFKGLDENEIESVLKSLKSRLVKYSKDEVIFETGLVIKEMALLLVEASILQNWIILGI